MNHLELLKKYMSYVLWSHGKSKEEVDSMRDCPVRFTQEEAAELHRILDEVSDE